MEEKELSVTTPWGFQYTLSVVPIEEAKLLIEERNGDELIEWTKRRTHGKVFKLNTGEVITTSYVDAIVYDSYKGYLTNMYSSGNYIRKHIQTVPPILHQCFVLGGKRLVYYQYGDLEKEILLSAAIPLEGSDGNLFLTPDKEVLTSGGVLYQSQEDYEAIMAFIKYKNKHWFSDARGESEMLGRNPYGKAFPEHLDELVAALPDIIHCPANVLNYQEASISKLDKYLYQNIISAEFENRIFLPLLAYIGQVFVQAFGGEWKLRYDEVYDHWYPDVKDKEGNFKEIFRPLLRILDYTEETWYPLRTVLLSKGAN
ncbi:MAG: hypothetical protein DHS20C18_42180 [Saprospiraceae bacterium]|nr:MAG: hypothetical protein DHS20C18_42180 [Saprospiraceae bacterium]